MCFLVEISSFLHLSNVFYFHSKLCDHSITYTWFIKCKWCKRCFTWGIFVIFLIQQQCRWCGRFKTQNYSDRKEMVKNMPEITGYSVGASPCDPPSHFSSSPLVWFNISTTKTLKSINWEGCKSVFSGLNIPWVLKVNCDDPHGSMAEIAFMRPQLLFNSCSLMLRGKEKATVKKH